jgi:hypothetical protein
MSKRTVKESFTQAAILRRKKYLRAVTTKGYIPDLALNGEPVNFSHNNPNPELMKKVMELPTLWIKRRTE